MLTFHNDASIKQKYLDRVLAHQKADNIIQGTGWENGKGCAVGCTLENYDHSQYPIELGIPEWLAHLEDRIFECLPNNIAKEWPHRFLVAVPIGIDLESIKHKLAIRRIDQLIELQSKNDTKKSYIIEVINSLKIVKSCHEAELNKSHCDWDAARSAARSAESAAWSATSAAESAAWSATSAARSAAESAAWSATSAARSAAMSAAWSATSAAESAAWQREADDLIELLESLNICSLVGQ